MGNTRSRPISTTTQPISDLTDESTMGAGTHKPLCLLQLLRRSWRLMLSPSSSKRQASSSEGVKDERDNSRCSLCKDCDHQQQELLFDSESDMAPNAEEDLLVAMQPRGPHSGKERLRPPTYNAEDYTQALRRWGRRALANQQPQHHQHDPGNHHSHHQHHNTLPSTCTSTSSSGYASTGNNGEMTLRQFTSVSELLNKLKADLKLAFPSFVQEFVSAPADGISLLLETLRGVQLSQSTPPSATGPRRPRARRAAMDELGCVECLAACADRCPDAGRLLAQAQPGLLALACCLTSSLNRSRVIALQLLTRVCQSLGGHNAVSEAVSTLRLRFGEGGRFRFLAGALLAPKAAPVLRLAGISFLNAFLASAPRAQTKLYIQAEACEAGLEPRALQEWLKYLDDDDPASESLRSEVRKWSRNCVDVDALQGRARRAEETCRALNKKVSVLQKQLQQLQLDKLNEYNSRQPKQQLSADLKKKQQQQLQQRPRKDTEKKVSSSAEDEGISFSERSSSPEDPTTATTATPNNQAQDNDQETTIDDVIEELRIIVKDAEEELHDWNQLQCRDSATAQNEFSRSGMVALNGKGPAPQPSKARQSLRISEESARLDRVMKNASAKAVGCLKIVVPGPQLSRETTDDEDKESAIVPAIIHPQPPRRAPPAAVLLANSLYPSHQLDASPILLAADDLANNSDLMLLHDEDEYGSDSLLSASKFNKLPIHQMHRNRRRPSSSSQDQKVESLTDFEISETILDERIPSLREREDIIGNSNSLGSKLQYSKCSSNTVQRKTERRKYLRRCQSQDHIEDSSSLHRNEAKLRTGVHDQIRKFESMNSFDERRSLPNYEDNNRLRRSESFHQTYAKNYTDDNEIATIMYKDSDDVEARDHFQRHNRKHRSITKSLDRIDEGLDSMVDVVVMRERQDHHQRRRSSEIEQRAKGEDKYTSFFDKKRERRDSGDKLQQQQYHDNDSRLFAGRHHDVLGFGKARFNAGMYSGNAHQQQQQLPLQQFMAKNIHPRGQTNILNHHNRGKVTDVVSGLY